MSDTTRPDPKSAYWDDYLREIGPDARASMRVRRGLDRALADRRRDEPGEAPTQPTPRAAAAIFILKSSAMSVGLALATLGGLHVGARAIAPAQLPTIAGPVATTEPVAIAGPNSTARSFGATPRTAPPPLRTPSEAAMVPAAPSVAPTQPARPSARRSTVANPTVTTSVAPPTDTLRAELELMDRAKAALAAGDDARVLTLLDAHAEQFADGGMIEERRGWTVVARCHLGAATARALAEQFARDYPRSMLLDDIHHACSKHSPTDSAGASE